MELAKTFGADVTIDVEEADPVKAVSELTEGRMADVVMDVSGNPDGQ
jgi:threonine dehydrogenase-like Zn-dependent dehydrogenase